jgi:uncharacterized protein YbjT (DUF2867 family)
MRIAITGGTGFVGSHLARRLVAGGHEVVLVARGKDNREPEILELKGAQFFASDLSSVQELIRGFAGCDAIVHCAGINRELGKQTYQRAHIDGTRNVVEVAKRIGARKLILLSFLRARPNCGSPYHESKWAAEEIVRSSELDYTIFKPGVIYGRGDHMLDHLSHALFTFSVFALVGFKEQPIQPLAVEDLTSVMEKSLTDARMSRHTFAARGPEEMKLIDAVERVGAAIGRKPWIFRMPLSFHYALAWFAELTMKIPIAARAQVRILSEGIVEPLPPCDFLPEDLRPSTQFTLDQIKEGLPPPGAFGWSDLRCAKQQGREMKVSRV